jgi:hypothetical protein
MIALTQKRFDSWTEILDYTDMIVEECIENYVIPTFSYYYNDEIDKYIVYTKIRL